LAPLRSVEEEMASLVEHVKGKHAAIAAAAATPPKPKAVGGSKGEGEKLEGNGKANFWGVVEDEEEKEDEEGNSGREAQSGGAVVREVFKERCPACCLSSFLPVACAATALRF
jgi:hypothetical protein